MKKRFTISKNQLRPGELGLHDQFRQDANMRARKNLKLRGVKSLEEEANEKGYSLLPSQKTYYRPIGSKVSHPGMQRKLLKEDNKEDDGETS